MCDYSLAVLPNRLGVEGEDLVVHRFNTGAKGLASPAELRAAEGQADNRPRRGFWRWLKRAIENSWNCSCVTAVCIPPGARLLAKGIPKDAVQFHNRREVLLQSLPEGLQVEVLFLGESRAEAGADGEDRFRDAAVWTHSAAGMLP